MSLVPNILHEDDVREVIQDEIEDTVGANQAAIADASESHAIADSFDDEEVEAALDALGATVNEILAALRAVGIIDTE